MKLYVPPEANWMLEALVASGANVIRDAFSDGNCTARTNWGWDVHLADSTYSQLGEHMIGLERYEPCSVLQAIYCLSSRKRHI